MAQYTLTSSSLSVLVIIRSSDVAETLSLLSVIECFAKSLKTGFYPELHIRGV